MGEILLDALWMDVDRADHMVIIYKHVFGKDERVTVGRSEDFDFGGYVF